MLDTGCLILDAGTADCQLKDCRLKDCQLKDCQLKDWHAALWAPVDEVFTLWPTESVSLSHQTYNLQLTTYDLQLEMQKNKDKNTQVIYGRHPVVEAVQAGMAIDKVLLQQGIRGELEKEMRHLCKRHNVHLQVIPREKLDKLAGGNHQGVAALVSLIDYADLEDILPLVYEQSEIPLIILLDGVTDVRNLGAIARSAECCGAHALVVPVKGSAQINSEAMKASAGALARLPVCRTNSLVNTIQWLQESGVQVMASDLKADHPIFRLDLSVPLAFVVGSEETGISPAVARLADQRFIIPQKSDLDSFNVSVAAGIMLYEALRQRMG